MFQMTTLGLTVVTRVDSCNQRLCTHSPFAEVRWN